MAYAIGAALALATMFLAHAIGLDRVRAFAPSLLIGVAGCYPLFAGAGGPASAMAIELMILAAFMTIALIGLRLCVRLVIAGLIVHGALDAVHPAVIVNDGVPEWWPAFCLAYDLTAAGCLAVRERAGAVPGVVAIQQGELKS